jgi:Flp pilus assembly protein TadG
MMTRLLFRRQRRGQQRGQVLVIFGLSAVALFGVLALAFDGGRVLMEQRNLQNATDGAALTGSLEIGPGTSTIQSHIAEDDAVYAVETALGISFSNNYSSTQEHYLNAGSGANCGAVACNPPYSDTCCTWTDTTGDYTLTVTTPYNWNGSDNEAYIHVDLVHRLPLMIGAEFFPKLAVHVQTTARNYALPYALYTLKYYDSSDYYINGSASLTANKKMGTNGSLHTVGAGHVQFNCISLANGVSTGYGGDLYEYVTSGTGGIGAGSVTTNCSSASTDNSIALQAMPPIHLPPDPYGSSATPAAISVTAPSGLSALQPTIPADPSQSPGPRYASVSVGSGSTLVLLPGVYFFEGTAASSGLLTKTATAALETGDCYNYTAPTCWTTSSVGNPNACPSGFTGTGGATVTLAAGGSATFACKTADFGVLLVFYPAGSDVTATCTNQNPASSGQYYCTKSSSFGNVNQFSIWAGSTLYLTSSPRYHNIVVYIDQLHANGTTMNYTSSTSLSNASCSTTACANQIGLGSQVITVGGGGSISINGAIVAPDDNVSLGGGTTGSGYGQIISYTLSTQGSSPLNESYNPLALAYSPVIVQ